MALSMVSCAVAEQETAGPAHNGNIAFRMMVTMGMVGE
jgi:hypothetical protein